MQLLYILMYTRIIESRSITKSWEKEKLSWPRHVKLNDAAAESAAFAIYILGSFCEAQINAMNRGLAPMITQNDYHLTPIDCCVSFILSLD